jgi:hypothetical protein
LTFVTLYLEHAVYRLPSPLNSIQIFIGTVLILAGLHEGVEREWMTLSAIGVGVIGLLVGFGANLQKYRMTSLVWLLVIGGYYIIADVFALSMPYRIASFIVLGLVLLGGSYGYYKLEARLKQ